MKSPDASNPQTSVTQTPDNSADFVLPAIIEEALARIADEDTTRIRTGYDAARDRPVTLRANTLKATREAVADALDAAGLAWEAVPWYEDAFMLPHVRERAIWDLPAYQAGELYLQSLSSMLPPLILAPAAGEDVLDMCAAPGGKTSQLAALSAGSAHLTACELHAPRAEKLEHNLAKLGVRNVNVMRTDARRLDTFFSFDKILLDAPCTGTGTLRAGDARAASRMTPALLAKVRRAQQALLDRALTVLKPGGLLVYSTCSILPQENDEQVSTALKKHRDCALVPIAPAPADENEETTENDAKHLQNPTAQHIIEAVASGAIPALPTELAGTLTVCPDRAFEGFYLACITKRRR